MRLFPLFADLHERAVLVVGGGAVATRKTQALLEAGARVTVGAPRLDQDLRALVDAGRVAHRAGEFDPAWLDGVWLVIAATDDRLVNRRVADAGAARRVFVNVVDDPELSSFQVPAVVDRAPLVVAISSSGVAPVLARRVRERIESLFDHSLGTLARLAERYRDDIRRRHADLGARRRFYDWLFDGPVAALVRGGHPVEAEAALAAALHAPHTPVPGRVLLVGAGPGPAALLTLQAVRALNEADVIVYDHRIPRDVLALARRDAEVLPWHAPASGPDGASRELLQVLATHVEQGRVAVHLNPGAPLELGAAAAEFSEWLGEDARYEVVAGLSDEAVGR